MEKIFFNASFLCKLPPTVCVLKLAELTTSLTDYAYF